jgi:hypothetical protein
MAIQGMNLPSIAGVLGFKDFTNQLNNANAGVRNAVGLVNDWAKMAAQQNNAEKAAQAQRDFTAEQNQINRDFQAQQQKERLDQEMGMWKANKAQNAEIEKARGIMGYEEMLNTPLTEKTDTNDMNILRMQNKVREVKNHPEWFTDENGNIDIKAQKKALDDLMDNIGTIKEANEDMKTSNKLKEEFKDYEKGDWRNAEDMLYWFDEHQDDIRRLNPELEAKLYQNLAKKDADREDWERDHRAKKRSEYRDVVTTRNVAQSENKKYNYSIPSK